MDKPQRWGLSGAATTADEHGSIPAPSHPAPQQVPNPHGFGHREEKTQLLPPHRPTSQQDAPGEHLTAPGPELKRDEPASAPGGFRLLRTSSPPGSERQTAPSSSSISSSSSSALRAPRGPSPAGTACYRRFLRTMKALKQSGLLDITLRTQELMRRSTATECDVAQLGQHTRLLCQLASQPGAASKGPAGHSPWERLHQAMAQSGSYPSLKVLHREPCSRGRDGDLPVSPSSSSSSPRPTPSPSPSPSPGLSQNRTGSEPSGNVSFMPPDSSTG